jgi:hypothetical protein
MEKGVLLVVVALTVVCLCGSAALALTPMGPPAAELNKAQFSAGVDYSYSQIDLKLNHGFSPGGGPSITLDNMKRHHVLANLGYGIRDDWEVSFRVGGGAVQDKEEGGRTFKTNRHGYTLGFGTKATLCETNGIKWGGLFQALWGQADGRAFVAGRSWTADIDFVEIQIAVGPTYRLNDTVSIYGGPFFHIFDGHFTAKDRPGTSRLSYDIDEGSVFGGYIGTGIRIASNTAFNIEYQHTAAADSLNMKLTWKF